MTQTILENITVRHGDDMRALAQSRAILTRIVAELAPRDFAVRFWNGETIPADAGKPARYTLVLNRPGALRRMFLPPNDLALGEAFVRGDFDVEGDLIAAMQLGDRVLQTQRRTGEWLVLARALLTLPSDAPTPQDGRQRAQLRAAVHSRARDRAAIQYHYDVGSDFYALWLDSRMVYSCAYFPTGEETLDSAQQAKLEIICR